MGNKRWIGDEEFTLLAFMGTNFQQYTKGVKTKFYTSASAALKTKTPTQVKSKCIELEGSYKEFKVKLCRSGFGLKENDPASIKELLSKKCKYFYEMDEMFGARHNIVPPVIMEPGRTEFGLQGATDLSTRSPPSMLSGAEQAIETNAALHGTYELSPSAPIAGDPLPSVDTTKSGQKRSYDSLRSPPPVARMLERLREDRERETTKRHKAEMGLREQEFALKKEQFELLKEELRLKEKKMDQQFALMTQQISLQNKQLELELSKR